MAMTLEEAVQKREELVAEQRKYAHAIKILKSESIPENGAIKTAIDIYESKIKMIDENLKDLSNQVLDAEKPEWTIEFNFEGESTYITECRIGIEKNPDADDLITWDSKESAEEFAKWYGYKHGWKIVPVSQYKKK